MESTELFEFALVHSGAPSGRWIHSSSLGFIRARLLSCGSFGFSWAHSGPPRGRRFHSGSSGFTPVRVMVVGFITVGV